MVKFHYVIVMMLMVTCVAFAQENATNQTNETGEEDDYVEQGKGILEGMYSNYKSIFATFSNATGIEAEAISAMLAVALILVLLGKRARKYLFYAMAIFVVLWIIGFV